MLLLHTKSRNKSLQLLELQLGQAPFGEIVGISNTWLTSSRTRCTSMVGFTSIGRTRRPRSQAWRPHAGVRCSWCLYRLLCWKGFKLFLLRGRVEYGQRSSGHQQVPNPTLHTGKNANAHCHGGERGDHRFQQGRNSNYDTAEVFKGSMEQSEKKEKRFCKIV